MNLDKEMNIKILLQDDQILFSNNGISKSRIIKTLNSMGIYTVEDYINYN